MSNQSRLGPKRLLVAVGALLLGALLFKLVGSGNRGSGKANRGLYMRENRAYDYLLKRVETQMDTPESSKQEEDVHKDTAQPVAEPRAPTQEDYDNMLRRQLEYCGELCTVDTSKLLKPPVVTSVESLKQSYISKPIQCERFFTKRAEELFDGEKLEWPPPRRPPVKFTVNNEHVQMYYQNNQQYSGKSALTPKWDTAKIEKDIALLQERKFRGSYGRNATYELHDFLDKYADLEGKRVAIVGTEHPWVETIVLKLGAREVVTIEYGTIITDHPRLKTMLPSQVYAAYREGTLEPFDVVVSFSSLEHTGLGRYGDIINPWGDVIWMAKLSCLVKQGGYAVIAVENASTDAIVYNAHRIYGPYRWPLLLQNWEAKHFRRVHDPFRHGLVLAVNQRK